MEGIETSFETPFAASRQVVTIALLWKGLKPSGLIETVDLFPCCNDCPAMEGIETRCRRFSTSTYGVVTIALLWKGLKHGWLCPQV